MIKHLKLENFRKFGKLELDLDYPILLIHGNNAQGKSTILEAIYMISNQSSPFTSEVAHLFHENETRENYFRIEMHVEHEGVTRSYSLFHNHKSKEYRIDNSKTTRKKFNENIASTIFSPEQIEQLMISPTRRREYLDQMIGRIDPDYLEILSKMRKVLRQRNAYLKKLSKSFYESGTIPEADKQLKYWSEIFNRFSVGVMIRRAQFISKMHDPSFAMGYIPSFELGGFTEMIDESDLLKAHEAATTNSHRRDVALGHTNIGAHRDDWSIFAGKNIRTHGSRGEKRMAIGRMILMSQEMFQQMHGFYPTLLLDDISSELDQSNTEAILNNDVVRKQQSIITTINLDDIPKAFKDDAKLISV